MMNYEEMSDNEINQAITALIFDCEEWTLSECGKYFYHCGVDGDGFFEKEVADYCNNQSDAWPIISRNLIGVSPDEDGVTCHFYGDWTARAFCSQICCTHKNPLRAAMIVFLMMRDEQCQKS